MVSGKKVITYKAGIHLRPATQICKVATEYKCKIDFVMGNVTADAKSIISLLGACIKCGTEVEVMCSGEDEEAAYEAIMDIIEKSCREKEGDK